jgi:ubiquitin carboxyl-terminal hydrolase 25/28
LKWLAPSHNDSFTLDDDQISSLATVKHDDATDSAEREKVKTAVRLIAEQRDSFALHAWQPNGNGSSDDDELTQAYKYYNIDDRSGFLDKDVLQTMLTMRQQDPDATLKGQQDAQKHYDVLLKNTNGNSNAPKAADYNNPVGLNNMGNTCYLNSLLQYFYTIKPFRDIVTNFNDHKQPLDDTILDSSLGRVGGMIVNRAEVKAAQEFLPELATLFDQMATAPGPEVSPEWKLACLALKQSPGLQKGPPRRATIVSPRPSNVLPATNGSTIAPPGNGPPTPESPAVSIDGSSDVTLIGDIVLTPDSDADDVQKESAMKVEPSGENVSLLTDGADGGHERADSMEVEDGTLCPPSRPPPVPPRPKTTTDSWKSEAETAAKQHDVQEVVTNLQNKALCAIKADGTDGNGNRNDKIKE